MAVDRGLPAVPQGLPRGLTVYLQALQAYLLRLAGNARGATETQAVRRAELSGYARVAAPAENSLTSAMLRDGAISTSKLADGAVTAEKIAAGVIDGSRLKQGTVTARELGAASVGEDALCSNAVITAKLADGAVTAEKLADGVLRDVATGQAMDGETVDLGDVWRSLIAVSVTGFQFPDPAGGALTVTAGNVRQENGKWLFDAVVRSVSPADPAAGTEEQVVRGTLFWCAVGVRHG